MVTPAPRAVIFDLAGTLVDWPTEPVDHRWAVSYDHLTTLYPDRAWPPRAAYVAAMRAAEEAHWDRVVATGGSGSAADLLHDGFHRLGWRPDDTDLHAALAGYARAIDRWTVACPDARATLATLRGRGYRLGLLSNTWWASAWHDAELAAHGLADLLDALLYTSDLAHSKPHPSVFRDLAARLGVDPAACVMVGDRMIDDVSGALGVGMRAVWKRHDKPLPRPPHIVPTAVVTRLAELPGLLRAWGGA